MPVLKISSYSKYEITPAEALKRCRWAFIGVGIASGLINILYLTGSFFMLEVYDRVLPSRSIPTLIALGLLALALYCFQGIFEMIRGRMLGRIAAALDELMNARVFRAMMRLPLKTKMSGDGLQPLRDFDQVRGFLSGIGPSALFDLPWLPFYVGLCLLFHPVIGWLAIFGALVLALLTILTNRGTRNYSKLASESANARNAYAMSTLRNAEVVRAMGMTDRITERWEQRNEAYRQQTLSASDISNGYTVLSKVFRMALQSGVLATGAVLVIQGEASAGIMIASSILTARALAPVELAIGTWRSFVGARQSWGRLTDLLQAIPETGIPLRLPAPRHRLTVDGLSGGAPSGRNMIFTDIHFTVAAGSAVGIIGDSASGKSSLGRALLGIWPANRGTVRLDGATIEQWDHCELGQHIGYLPQDVELFSGTVAQNIARFSAHATADAIIAAAHAARVHDLIIGLPDGYETEIGDGGTLLSAGQRQRVALARALYGDPFLVLLDEPNSNLDSEGERALSEAIMGARARGGIVLVIAHRPSVLVATDLVLLMNSGRVQAFGARDEVLGRVVQRNERPAQLAVVSETAQVGQ